MCVKVIASQRWDVFLRHGVNALHIWHLVPWPSIDIHEKLYGDHSRVSPPSGELNRRGVAKYSTFGPINGYISEKVQDRR